MCGPDGRNAGSTGLLCHACMPVKDWGRNRLYQTDQYLPGLAMQVDPVILYADWFVAHATLV